MKILLVGKTGYFETLAVALGYLNIIDVTACPYFADLEMEQKQKIMSIGQHKNGDEVFVTGYKIPPILKTINDEINSLTQIKPSDKLNVIPLTIPGENATYFLTQLAALPLIGKVFLNWAKSRTLDRRLMLYQMGENLVSRDNHTLDSITRPAAAKPYLEDTAPTKQPD
jgi:hypothetical protein